MSERFPAYLPSSKTNMYPVPVEYAVRTYAYNAKTHPGVDLGWSKALGPTQSIYAIKAGKVMNLVDGLDNHAGKRGYGNFVLLDHGDSTFSLYAHIHKSSFVVAPGDTVAQGQKLALMGNSGNSTGYHLHFEYRVGGSGPSFRVNPEKHIFLYDAHSTTEATAKLFSHVLGTPQTATNETQLEVFADFLRCRAAPSLSGDTLGFAAQGRYSFTEICEADGYSWYRIGGKYWAAQADGYSRLVTPPESELQKLKTENAQLVQANTVLKSAIDAALSALRAI